MKRRRRNARGELTPGAAGAMAIFLLGLFLILPAALLLAALA